MIRVARRYIARAVLFAVCSICVVAHAFVHAQPQPAQGTFNVTPTRYLLPGETRMYQLPIAPEVCRALASVVVAATLAQMPGQTLEERVAVDAGACKAG